MHVDEWGRVLFTADGIIDLLLKGSDVSNLTVEDTPELEAYNKWCQHNDKGRFVLDAVKVPERTPEEEHGARAATWLLPEAIREVNVREYLLSLCADDVARDRVNEEMDMFEERQLEPLLQLMIYLVYHFTQNKIVWGVGRGSSVSSYVLFLIGIHKIDSIKYGLDVHDFLR
jgi:DNA polymerase III alpha subunit